MKHLLLAVKRPFNARAYLILLGLLFPAVFAIYPYLLTQTATPYPGLWNLILSAGTDFLLYAVLGAAGLWFASRTGLGMPLIEGWTKREPSWNRLPGVVGMSILAGILLILFATMEGVFADFMQPVTETQAGGATTEVIVPPAWQGFLAAFSAAITEETMYRLFGLTLLAWLGSLVFRSRTGRPALWLLWTANLLFALLFGLMHLNTASQLGIPIDAVYVIRTLIRNGAGGILFGWLYWSFGLESAMLAHMSADVVRHGFIPLVTQQVDPTARIITGAIVGLVIVLTVIWSIWAIRRDRKQFPPSAGSDSLQQMKADFSNPTV